MNLGLDFFEIGDDGLVRILNMSEANLKNGRRGRRGNGVKILIIFFKVKARGHMGLFNIAAILSLTVGAPKKIYNVHFKPYETFNFNL